MNSDVYAATRGRIYRAHLNGFITLDECDRALIQLAQFYYGKTVSPQYK